MTQPTHSPPDPPDTAPAAHPTRADERPRLPLLHAVVLAGAALLVVVLIVMSVHIFTRTIELIITAIVIGEALSPIVDLLDRRMPRGLAIAIVYVLLILIFALIGWIVLPKLIAQTQQVIANSPQMLAAAKRWIDHLGIASSGQVQNALAAALKSVGGAIIGLPFTIFSSTLEVLAVFFMSVYWLIEKRRLRAFTLSLFPPRHQEQAGAVFSEMGHSMGGYIRGVVLDGLVIGTLDYIGLIVIGVKYPVVLAILSGLAELLPIIGPILAAIPAIAVTLFQSFTKTLILIGFKLALHQTEGHLVAPNIMRSQTDVPQLLVIIAVVAGGSVGGILGALVAVPIAAAGRVLLIRVVAPYIRGRAGATEKEAEQPS